MSFLETVQAHRGGLVLLKTGLFWYSKGEWDNEPGRICLILDAYKNISIDEGPPAACSATTASRCDVLLLIDGSTQLIWIDEHDVEFLVDDSFVSEKTA